MPMITVTPTPLLELDNLTAWDVVTVTAGPDADLLVLLRERPEPLSSDPEQAGYPIAATRHYLLQRQTRYRILHDREDGLVIVDLPAAVQDYGLVQPLPGDEYLLMATWPNDAPTNAHVYTAAGTYLRSWPAGRCAQHVQASASGSVWVGYCDMGTVQAGGPDPLGPNGVTCLDGNGNALVSYNDLARPQKDVPNILECYALNVVSNEEIWLYYYDDRAEFTIARLRNGHIDPYWVDDAHALPIAGSESFAVVGDRLLFYGGFRDTSLHGSAGFGHLYLVSTSEQLVEEIAVTGIRDAQHGAFQSFARGSRLYLWTERAVWMIDAATLP